MYYILKPYYKKRAKIYHSNLSLKILMSKNEKSKILKIFFFSVFFRFFFQTNYRKKKINYKKIKKNFNFQKYFTELKIGHKKMSKIKKKIFPFFFKNFSLFFRKYFSYVLW